MSAPAAEAPGLKAAADALDDDELHTLSAHATEQTYHKNTVVVNEGDRSNSIFVAAGKATAAKIAASPNSHQRKRISQVVKLNDQLGVVIRATMLELRS